MNFEISELLALLGGLSFIILSLLMPFRIKYKILFISIGIVVIIISFFEQNKILDIIGVTLLITPFLVFRIKRNDLYKK